MESTGRFEEYFLEALKESNTAGAGGAFGDGPSTADLYVPSEQGSGVKKSNTPEDNRIGKALGSGRVQTRNLTTGGKKKKKKKKKTDGLDGVFLTGEEGEEGRPEEDAEKADKDRMKCNSPRRTSGGSKKFVVKACKDGKEKIVRYGDPNMRIKKSNPKRRKSFRARHKCDQKKDKFSAGYWSCKKW